MPQPVIHSTTTFEDAGKTLMARVVGEDAAVLLQADVTAITVKEYEQGDLATELNTDTPVVGNVIFDTLQTDDVWVDEVTGLAIDTTGYNFKHIVPGAWFPGANKIYIIEFLFDLVTGEDFFVKFKVSTLRIETS